MSKALIASQIISNFRYRRKIKDLRVEQARHLFSNVFSNKGFAQCDIPEVVTDDAPGLLVQKKM